MWRLYILVVCLNVSGWEIMELEEPINQTAWPYAAFVLVLLAVLAFTPNPAFIVAGVIVLALFYSTSTPPSRAILEHQAHP